MCGDKGISAFPDGDNLFQWIGTIHGATGTVSTLRQFPGSQILREVWLSFAIFFLQVYEGLKYKLSLEFPSGYPYVPPSVKFVTPCFHPNVDVQGYICLDILKEKWSALYDVRTVLISIQSLLGGEMLFGEITRIKPNWHVVHYPGLGFFYLFLTSNT